MATTHKKIDQETLENLLYLSRLSPESTDMETLKKQVDEIVGYFEILSNTTTAKILMTHILLPRLKNFAVTRLWKVLKSQT